MYYLGIDACGAFARLSALDTDMKIIGRHVGDIFDEKNAGLKRDNFKKLLLEFNRMTNTVLNDCLGLCFGVGAGTRLKQTYLDDFFAELALPFPVRAADEAALMIYAQFKKKQGVAVFCGFDSWCAAYGETGGRFFGGAFGETFDDGLSARGCGAKAVRAALSDFDDCGVKTVLREAIPAFFKLSDINAVKNAFLNGKLGKRNLSELTGVINDACKNGDAAAIEILLTCARHLSDLALSLYKKANLPDLSVVCGGDMLLSCDNVFDAFSRNIKKTAPKAEILRLSEKLEQGAIYCAADIFAKEP